MKSAVIAGKDQEIKLSLPRASSLNENVDHSALLKLGTTVSDRVNRFDPKGDSGGSAAGISKLQETRRIFEQRTLQVSTVLVSFAFFFREDLTNRVLPPTGEAGSHKPDLIEKRAGVRLSGQSSGCRGSLQRLHRGSG